MPRVLAFISVLLMFSCSSTSRISKQANNYIIEDKSLKSAHVGISIYDPEAGKSIYSYQSDKYFVPASNTKIPTCYVALKYLPDSLLSYYYKTNEDTIYIQPAGDPAFLHPDYSNQSSFEFLKNFRQLNMEDAGFRQFLGSGWSWNDYQENYMAQRSMLPLYGNVTRITRLDSVSLSIKPSYFHHFLTLTATMPKGIKVEKPWEENTFKVSPGTSHTVVIPFRPYIETIALLLQDSLKRPVKIVPQQPRFALSKFSQVKDSMLKPMMHRSDNFFAEQTLVMAAKQAMNSNNVNSILDTVIKTDFAGLAQKPRWVDGSGLSRYNLFTPESLVGILDKMQMEFGMERMKIIFPAADEGTLQNYYKGYANRFYAKTGTLSGVVALSGYLFTNKNRLLIFSILVNNHQASAADVRRAVEKFLTGIMTSD